MTLTYGGGDHPAAQFLTYEHVQRWLVEVRRKASVRYLAVGEYGSEKGRAHWHVLLFYEKGAPPDVELNKRINHKMWKHGFSQWEEISTQAIRYCVKYVQKDKGALEKQAKFALSKRPALGAKYFVKLASEYVEAGLSPKELSYSFPDVLNKKTKLPETFRLPKQSFSAAHFVESFVRLWQEKYGNSRWPSSELVDYFLDREAAKTPLDLGKERFAGRVPKPERPPPHGSEPVYSPSVNAYFSDTPICRLWFYRNKEGDLVWHEKLGKAGNAVRNGRIVLKGLRPDG
ncbi:MULTISPECIES: hypothetical protein [unclassified Mesorhizobium]|uniref:rolling circle replication-associated protein n=1 Tax=unclassified Mesorhizobium TaxID=325217 RepID=UPI000FCABFDD|nr:MULTISPECIES: hypothetical protein [unclassified Mesorhizobium]RUW01424.1 hypothetical protein EOA49_11245 [Mesorhizobium sp. M1A.F.Ca.IN.020.04.1.1]RUW12021.1 hypothetical protein EOA53_11405 [Mesorhizobium sp. M1A.F.Ca.IN.020.03.1.1]